MCNNNCTLTTHDKECKGRNCGECWVNYCQFDDKICPMQLEDKLMWNDEHSRKELIIQLKWAGYTEKEIEQVMKQGVDHEGYPLPRNGNRDCR